MPPEVQSAIDIIGNMARTEILRVLAATPLTGPELASKLGAERTSVYLHLRALEEAGLVQADHAPDQRRGRTVRWSTIPEKVDELGAKWIRYANGN